MAKAKIEPLISGGMVDSKAAGVPTNIILLNFTVTLCVKWEKEHIKWYKYCIILAWCSCMLSIDSIVSWMSASQLLTFCIIYY